jgi:lysophospholipase L1-like esterase
MSTARLREIAARLGLVLAGVVGGLLLLEIALQAAALVVRLSGLDPVATAPGDRVRVMCVGDSNTYGLWVERDEAWPRVLERRWNATDGAPPIEVLNLGVPGANSSGLRAALPKLLEAARPAVVVVMVGANDFWTEPVPPPALDLGKGLMARVRRNSRVWRLFRMIARSVAGPGEGVLVFEGDHRNGASVARIGDVDVTMRWKMRPEGVRKWTKDLRPNLLWIVGQIRAAGAEPVLVTYASSDLAYGAASQAIRDVARMKQTPLVDPSGLFHERCPTPPCELLFADGHPTAAGYALIAEAVQDGLTAAGLQAVTAGSAAPAPDPADS